MLIARFLYNGAILYGRIEPGAEQYDVVADHVFERIELTGQVVRCRDATLLPPISPRIIIGLGRNYHSHNEEMGVASPDRPAFFFKPASTMVPHLSPVAIPHWATRVDYEGELGVIIGRKMRCVPEKSVAPYVFGCTCFNDVTERHIGSTGLINQDISKCCDTFGPCGPWISTETDPDNANLRTIHNGTVVQQDCTTNTVYSVARILSELSFFMTLMPGDLVITGTPGGIGPLQIGDIIEVEVDGIGRLTNQVTQDNQKAA